MCLTELRSRGPLFRAIESRPCHRGTIFAVMRRWKVGIVWVLTGCLMAAACRSTEGRSVPSSTTRERPPVAAPRLPAGTPLGDGFTAPAGTEVLGGVFPIPPDGEQTLGGWSALMIVNEKPPLVWESVVAQAAAIDTGWPFPANSFCHFTEASSMNLDCDLGIDVARPSGAMNAKISLRWGSGAAHLLIETYRHRGPPYGRHIDEPPAKALDPVPVPPSGLPAHVPGPGGPLGTRNNCFARGYATLRVPPDSLVVAPWGRGIGNWDFAAVLRVRDAHDDVQNLQHQLTIDDTGKPIPGQPEIRSQPVQGGTVWIAPGGNTGGGGGCAIRSTPDGQYVFVATHSD